MAQNKPKSIGNDLGLTNVLVVRYGAMGNVVMTIPIVYSACLCYPDVQFFMVTKPSLTGLFVNCPPNFTVIGIDMDRQYKGLSGAKAFVHEMFDGLRIDAMIDLQNDSSTWLVGFLGRLHGIKTVRFNRASHNKHLLTRKTNKVMLPLTPSTARYRETFFKAGLPIDEVFDNLYGTGKKADPKLFDKISAPKGDDETWIGIAPFAAHPEKEYPTDQMEAVIKMIIDNHKAKIFVFGDKGREAEIAQKWAQKYPEIHSLAGNKYGFPAELALLSNIDVMLTMDSANMHLASIVGVPTVSVWGATHQYCGFMGWRQNENDMVQVPLSCRPCSIKGDKACYRHDRLCLTAIRPEMIYNKIAEKLSC